jgi:molybdopterin synthase sulfur carrier subunit
MAVNVRVRFFAVAREWMGTSALELAIPEGATTEVLWEELVRRQPKMKPWRERFRLAVNDEYAVGPVVLRPGDTVAVIPPVSGG